MQKERDKLKANLELKELELNALLEITQAINNNLSENSLYKIYNFTIRANLNIGKLALYVLDDEWLCKTHFGTKADFSDIPLDKFYLQISGVADIMDAVGHFKEFDLVIPVAHKNTNLAFVFVSSSGKERKEINTNFIQAISNIIIVAIENKKLARRQLEQEMIRRELEIAGKLQNLLVPKKLPYEDHLKVMAYYKPHHSIGGDYYDFIQINEDQILFCIADVSGKGIPAAMLMSSFQASLRTLVRQSTLFNEIVPELNYQILNNANGQHFITFFLGIYDFSRKRLKYVNAGHNHPYLLTGNSDPIMLNKGTTILGAFENLPFLDVGIIEQLPEFRFFGYTDGLTETFNARNEEYGENRLTKFILGNKSVDLVDFKSGMIKELDNFRGNAPMHDDISFLIFEVKNYG